MSLKVSEILATKFCANCFNGWLGTQLREVGVDIICYDNVVADTVWLTTTLDGLSLLHVQHEMP